MLFNATSLKEPSVLNAACTHGLVGAMQRAATSALAHGRTDGLCLACATLTNLAEGCGEGCAHFVRATDGVVLIRALIEGTTAATATLSADVRQAAATLLLALCTAAPSRVAMLDAGARASLEAIASATWSNEVGAARAKQALRELV